MDSTQTSLIIRKIINLQLELLMYFAVVINSDVIRNS